MRYIIINISIYPQMQPEPARQEEQPCPKCQHHPDTPAEFVCLALNCSHTFFCHHPQCLQIHARHSLKMANLRALQLKLHEPVVNSDPIFDQVQKQIEQYYDHHREQILNQILLHKEETLQLAKQFRTQKITLPQPDEELIKRATKDIKGCSKQQLLKVLHLCQKDFDPEDVATTKTKYLLEQVRQKARTIDFTKTLCANFQFKSGASEAIQSLKITPEQYTNLITEMKGNQIKNAVTVYNAKVHGFNAATVRQHLKQPQNTRFLFLIRTTNGQLFGCYKSFFGGQYFVITFDKSQADRFQQPDFFDHQGTNPEFNGGFAWIVRKTVFAQPQFRSTLFGGLTARADNIRLFLSNDCDKNSDSFFNFSNSSQTKEVTKFRVQNYIVLSIGSQN